MDDYAEKRSYGEEIKMIPMHHNDMSDGLNELSGQLVDALFHVHKELGPGFPESIYEEALIFELESRKIPVQKQKSFCVTYKGKSLSTAFRPDLIISNQIIIELKAIDKINAVHQSQIYSYLKATRLPLGFLVNFNVSLIKDGISRFKNKHSETPHLRVKNTETAA